MLVGGLNQAKTDKTITSKEYKQRCESLMLRRSNYYATTETSFKYQEHDCA